MPDVPHLHSHLVNVLAVILDEAALRLSAPLVPL